jgi:hypothetical protein
MTGPIAPIRAIATVPRRRREDAAQPRADAVEETFDVRISVAAKPSAASPAGRPAPPTNLAAHMLAQSAQTRGLRAGTERLGAARTVYLETEFSGPNDRRPTKGLITKREV